MNLAQASVGETVEIEHVGGERAFRRRLMELGLVPGTRVALVGVAPLGDPLELSVRGCSLSIRRADAATVSVRRADAPAGAAAHGSAPRDAATPLGRYAESA
ncbi:MAG: FeoA family protein [Sorangiineae bacterium]|nr:FeoA family protein [Polyangiaceae bacterium]MEB2321621.1 FeoA family protein [Sorangiineae bacterium]